MYMITYKNTMRTGKSINDFLEWLTMAWAIQKDWGADDVRYWQVKEKNIIICQYLITDLSQWIKMAQSSQGVKISNALDNVIDTDNMLLKITRTDASAA